MLVTNVYNDQGLLALTTVQKEIMVIVTKEKNENAHVSYRVPKNNLSVVPGRAASGQQHLQPSNV